MVWISVREEDSEISRGGEKSLALSMKFSASCEN
jgi:hypothetical protein